MLDVNTVPFDSDGQTLLKQVAGHFGVEDTFRRTPVGIYFGAPGQQVRPLFRQQRARPYRLHTLRRLHGGLPCWREEHAG